MPVNQMSCMKDEDRAIAGREWKASSATSMLSVMPELFRFGWQPVDLSPFGASWPHCRSSLCSWHRNKSPPQTLMVPGRFGSGRFVLHVS
eukprot:COSAG02_NODE_52698_length_306_cov_0.753623_1_plen_89_part_10